MQNLSPEDIFHCFLKEASFAREVLGLGITRISEANYAFKGVYYDSFVCISTGLERIGKICLILDYYIDNAKFPDNNYLKKQIGHDIKQIFKQIAKIENKHNIELGFEYDFSSVIYNNIIDVLSDFAKGNRYSNIDNIVGIKSVDSIKKWHDLVDIPLYETHVSENKKAKIIYNAEIAEALLGSFSLVRHTSEDGSCIDNVKTGSFETGVNEAIVKYRRMYLLILTRYFSEILISLGYKANSLGKQSFPYFSEIFGLFYNDNNYFKNRKTWIKA